MMKKLFKKKSKWLKLLSDKKKSWIFWLILVAVVLVVIIISVQVRENREFRGREVNGFLSTPYGAEGMPVTSGTTSIVMKNKIIDGKKEVPGASMFIANGSLNPNEFSVAANSKVSLTAKSGDARSHNIVFSDANFKANNIDVSVNESKTVLFSVTKAGEYEFHCNIPGHEKETGKMIVK